MISRRQKLGSAAARLRARDAGEEAALAEVGQQPREPRRPGGAEALLGLADQVDERARAVEQLEQLRVVVGQPQVAVAREVAQHPAARALVGVEALERVARPHPRLHAELRRLPGHPGVRADGADDQRSARADDDRAPRLGAVAPALDRQLLVADPDPHPVAQRQRPGQHRAVDEGAVAGARVLDPARRRAEIRACVRETLGSSSRSVEPGERPITTSSTSGTRSPPARTSSSGASPLAERRAAAAAEGEPRASPGGGSPGTALRLRPTPRPAAGRPGCRR